MIGSSLGGMAATAHPAHAYETDQLTFREQPLDDAMPAANAHMDAVIARAVDKTRTPRLCSASDARLRHKVGRAVARETSRPQVAWRRGFPRMFGHNAAAAWLETGPVDRIGFDGRDDVFGELSLRESVILHLMGPSSTVRFGDVRLGTDKIDHFFSEGWTYARRGRGHADPLPGIRWGTRTENTYFGTLTSRAFSFADLRANVDGFKFYTGLLGPGSVVVRDEDGCPTQARPWDWAEWVDWEYDEVLNPSVFAPIVQRGITRLLEERREQTCAAWRSWHTPESDERLARSLAGVPDYVHGRSPARQDPFQLAVLCGG